MFKRLELEAWHEMLPFIGFFLTFAVFIAVLLKALRLEQGSAEKLAALPFEQQDNTEDSSKPDGR